MGRENVISNTAQGVEMRRNPLDLDVQKFSHACNMAFHENSIKTRPGFRYHKLNINGMWQGGSYFSPSTGLSAENYSNLPNGLVNVVDGSVYITPLTSDSDDLPEPWVVGQVNSASKNVYNYDAENYLILHVENGSTYWSDGGLGLEKSQGLADCADDHDQLNGIKNHVPCGATVGEYIHGRLHVAVPFSCNNTEIAVGDLITKRGCKCEDDLLHFTEHCNPSHGGGLTAPSKFGPTLALAVMPDSAANGEGSLYDFRKNGIVRHDTLLDQRETRYDAAGNRISEGWDTRRITNAVLNTIGAVGRYAVYQLPQDIMFRSQYGLHFLKTSLGIGTFNDETTNVLSQDVEPLINIENDTSLLEGASVGHWLKCNRFFASVNHRKTDNTSSTSAQGFVSFNQASTYTEDRTPRFITEGLWKPDEHITDIHMFVEAGECKDGGRYGFICSDKTGELYFAEFDKNLKGVDVRDGKEIAIDWSLHTGEFLMNGFTSRKDVSNGFLDAVINHTTTKIESYIKSDESNCWIDWSDVECESNTMSLMTGYEFNSSSVEGTSFQFKLKGSGYVDIRRLDVDWGKIESKTDGKGNCIEICEDSEVDWFAE